MNIEQILENVLLNENPILFLGAGFSLGGKLKNGDPIPTGEQLKQHLLKSYLNLEEVSDDYRSLNYYNLDKVCEYIETVEGPKKLNDYLLDYFRYTTFADFHLKLPNYNWNKIYTVNIDDIIETVYTHNQREIHLQNSKVKSSLQKKNAVEVIKLHGCINNPSEGITFSTQQYIDSMIRDRDYRFTSLSLDMQDKPIIIVGATFDEINIDYYLKLYENAGYTSLRGKLFLINPNPPLLNSKKIEKLGGYIIKWTTEQFLEYISTKFKDSIPQKKEIEKKIRANGFLEVDKISSTLTLESKYTGSLYWGYTPTWEDVFYEWDFRDIEAEKKISNFLERYESKQIAVLSFVGKTLSSKSTLMKRLALTLVRSNYKVLYFNGKSIDSNFLREAIKEIDHNNFAIFVDDASYYYAALKRFVHKVSPNVKVRIITASKPYSHYRFRYQFVGLPFIEAELSPALNEPFSLEIAKRLDEKGYLGDLKRYDLDNRARAILSHGDLISFLFAHSYGKGFKRRFISIVENTKLNDECKDLLTILCIFNKLELPYLPFELASIIFSNSIEKNINQLAGVLKENNSNRLELRADFIGDYYINKVRSWKKIQIIKTVLIAISPLVNPFDHSYWNEIQASLIKEKYLRSNLKFSAEEIRRMLYDVRNYYNDDFNFWIQLGITEQRRDDFVKALNHFKTAESLNETSYLVKNSIGRNYMRHARYMFEEQQALLMFQKGENILFKLINEEEEYKARAYASHSYLSESIQFYEKFKKLAIKSRITKMSKILDNMLTHDPEDPMTMEVNNKFLRFLQRTKSTSGFTYTFKDLSKLKPMFYDYGDELVLDD